MPKVLTISSVVKCAPNPGGAHGGTVAAPVPGPARLKVNGSAVLVQGSQTGLRVAGCGNPTSPGSKPCVTVLAEVQAAQRLTVDGKPVLLEVTSGATDGVPPGRLSPTANQSLLSAS